METLDTTLLSEELPDFVLGREVGSGRILMAGRPFSLGLQHCLIPIMQH